MEKAEMRKKVAELAIESPSYEVALHKITRFWANNAQLDLLNDFTDYTVSVLSDVFGVANESK